MNITLLDGRSVDSDNLSFDGNTYRVFLGYEDVTNEVRRSDKVALWDIDQDRENNRVFAENYAAKNGGQQPSPLGSTSTLGNFTQQILHDPLAAPLDLLNATVNKIFTAPGVIKVLVISAIIGGAYWFFKVRRKG